MLSVVYLVVRNSISDWYKLVGFQRGANLNLFYVFMPCLCFDLNLAVSWSLGLMEYLLSLNYLWLSPYLFRIYCIHLPEHCCCYPENGLIHNLVLIYYQPIMYSPFLLLVLLFFLDDMVVDFDLLLLFILLRKFTVLLADVLPCWHSDFLLASIMSSGVSIYR